jgi:hypothetical protein
MNFPKNGKSFPTNYLSFPKKVISSLIGSAEFKDRFGGRGAKGLRSEGVTTEKEAFLGVGNH